MRPALCVTELLLILTGFDAIAKAMHGTLTGNGWQQHVASIHVQHEATKMIFTEHGKPYRSKQVA